MNLIELSITLSPNCSKESAPILIDSTVISNLSTNEFIINSLLEKFDITVEPINIGTDSLLQFGDKVMDNSIKFTKRFYPHIHNTNGFFIAKLRVNNTMQ